MFSTLMTSRRFAPLFWCQFFSAFNDNFVRNMLAMLILFRFGGGDSGAKILFASMAFVLPAIPLSALGGEIADSHDKALVARRLKLAEIGVLHGLVILLVIMPLAPQLHPRMASTYDLPAATTRLYPPGFMALHYGYATPIVTLLFFSLR